MIIKEIKEVAKITEPVNSTLFFSVPINRDQYISAILPGIELNAIIWIGRIDSLYEEFRTGIIIGISKNDKIPSPNATETVTTFNFLFKIPRASSGSVIL